MNYQKIYQQLVDRGKHRILGGYTETHHIVPTCMGGDDSVCNLVELTPEEHFVAHQLLVKMYPDNHLLVFALSRMAGVSSENNVRLNKRYGWLRRKFSVAIAEQNRGISPPNKGKPCTAEQKAKISAKLTGRTLTPEHRAKISAAGKRRYEKV